MVQACDRQGDHAGREDPPTFRLVIVSFGYKQGVPPSSELEVDVRFLPNPYFVDHLRKKTGRDIEVIDFMKESTDTSEIIDRIESLLDFLLPRYAREGKSTCTLAIGCTGGRHRSVMVAGEVTELFRRKGYNVKLINRDVDLS
jgi:UPF0042 nucleotide-binding protein